MGLQSGGWLDRTAACRFLFVMFFLCVAYPVRSASITINGAQTYQVIDGFGVNANHRGWNGTELQPVLNALIDQAGMTLFRIVYDKTDWEATNDNSNPAIMNWTYYNTIYNSAEFNKLWDMTAYLNQRGITDGTIFNFMGASPAWMGGGWLDSGQEDEWAEQIASLLYYGRNTKGLSFSMVAPNNEPDYVNEGISMDASQYATSLHKLSQRLDANGMSDVRFIGPDLASGGTAYMPEMLADSTIMSKLAHFGLHSYSNGGGGTDGVYDYIHASAYPDRTFWMTEFNVWCSTCDSVVRGTYDWEYCRGTAENLLGHLANGASGGIVWEGYDSYYLHPPGGWSFWGLFSVDNENAATKTYTARKNFYTMAQISRFIRPGARRVDVGGSTYPFWWVLAFYHSGLNQVSIVGINPSNQPETLSGTLQALPAISGLDLYYTSASANLASGGRVSVNNGDFSATIPADCVFTLTGSLVEPASIAVAPASQDFGTIKVGTTTDRAFTVENTGGGTLAGTASVAAPFSIVSGGSYSLTAGQTQSVTVRYSPTSPDTHNGDASFTGGGGASRAVSGSAYRSALVSAFDADGDGKADLRVLRPSTWTWYSLSSANPGTFTATRWGTESDVPLYGDYDRDSKADTAVWRSASGTWFNLLSRAPDTYTSTQWGLSTDMPVPADYDGDGKTDIAVWRPGTGTWYVRPSSAPGTYTSAQWGLDDDIPIPADYDGDDKTDIAVWRPGTGIWYIRLSGSPGTYTATQWGLSPDVPAPADYDGDGKTEIAVWRPSTGIWYIKPSGSPGTYTATQWGLSTDVPVPADYDGDGKSDIAVWRSGSGVWYVLASASAGSYTCTQWGTSGDLPLSPITGILASVP
jgi:O-glycosyl hydrolase